MDQAVTIAPADESERLARSVETVSLDANTSEPTVCHLESTLYYTNALVMVFDIIARTEARGIFSTTRMVSMNNFIGERMVK